MPRTSEDSIAVFKNITQPRQRYKASVRSTNRSNPGQRKKNTRAGFPDRNRAQKIEIIYLISNSFTSKTRVLLAGIPGIALLP